MALGYYDEDGFWHYGEDDLADPGAGFSDLLNKSTEALPAAVHYRVVSELAADPTIREGAEAAVADTVEGLSIVEGIAIPNVTENPAISIPFEDGSRNFLEAGFDGRPTSLSRDLLTESLSDPLGEVFGIEYALTPTPGVRAAFVFETGEVAAIFTDDGQLLGDGQTPTSIWPAVALGDSTTYNVQDASETEVAVTAAERWTELLATGVGQSIENWGRSGSRTEEVAWIYGAVTITGSPTATIPASGTVDIASLDIDPFRSNVTTLQVPVIGIADDGTIIRGTFTRTSETVRRLTVASTSTGAAVTTSKIVLRAVQDVADRMLFLGLGINNESRIVDGTQTVDQIKAWYTAVTSRHRGPIVVWGLIDRGVAESAGTPIGDFIREIERWAATEFGDAWCPLRRYLASDQALADAQLLEPSFTPTSNDLAAVAAGTVPPSFRTGTNSVHLRGRGLRLQARYLHRHLILRGLINA